MKILLAILLLAISGPLPAEDLPQPIAEALRTADRMVVYSITPERSTTGIRGFAIRSFSPVNQQKNVQLIATTLAKSITDGGASAFCFAPHHAVRIFRRHRMSDLVICYHCGAYQFFSGPITIEGAIGGDSTFLDQFMPPYKTSKSKATAAPAP